MEQGPQPRIRKTEQQSARRPSRQRDSNCRRAVRPRTANSAPRLRCREQAPWIGGALSGRRTRKRRAWLSPRQATTSPLSLTGQRAGNGRECRGHFNACFTGAEQASMGRQPDDRPDPSCSPQRGPAAGGQPVGRPSTGPPGRRGGREAVRTGRILAGASLTRGREERLNEPTQGRA